MNVQIEESWKQRLQGEFDKPYFQQLTERVRQEYTTTTCYPPGRLIFNAFNLCPFNEVKVVIIGQDPYHEPGQAHGLSFSVQDGVVFPPSLQNIFKEIEMDLGTPVPQSGNLERWARQGVLLLNATLTVRAHQANSHALIGWREFTDAAIAALGADVPTIVADFEWSARLAASPILQDGQGESPLSLCTQYFYRQLLFLEQRYGSLEGYLQHIGLTDSDFQALRQQLLE